MAKPKVASIVWTDRSLENAISIKEYLTHHFSKKEKDNFFALLQAFEIAVCAFPELYPQSGIKRNIRRAVLSKVLSAYYRINKRRVEALALLDNRCEIEKWF